MDSFSLRELIFQLDIESLINLYFTNKEVKLLLDNKEILFVLGRKFNLAKSNTFKEFVYNYDHKYVTKRCFNYFSLEDCLFKASSEGNIDVVKTAISKIKNENVAKYEEIGLYNGTMANAAQGGYKEIVQMMLDLGANEYNRAMDEAAEEGHKEIVDLIAMYANKVR